MATSEITSSPAPNLSAATPGPVTDSSPLPITSHKLAGHNYLQWSQSVMMYVCGKGREDHLTGTAAPPNKNDPTYKMWKAENSMVMSWLINSMTNEISENFLLYSTAQEIWEAARETFSNKENTAELFAVESVLHDLKQGESSVTTYFSTLTRYWQQLDLFEIHDWKCPTDEAKFRKIVETKRVFKFLLGLNQSLDEVRGRVLATKPLPSVREAFAEVRREESRCKVMLGQQGMTQPSDSSALTTQGSPREDLSRANAAQVPPSQPNDRARRGRPWCEHCRRPGHTKETCWKLHGKPADWKPSRTHNERESRANAVSSESPTAHSPFSKDQMDILQKLISQAYSSSSTPTIISTGSVAQRGNIPSALHVSHHSLTPWIVDSGASDHMTGDKNLFSSFSPCTKDMTVRIADGTCSQVIGKGTVHISQDLILHSVLFVPKLDCNLLSVSKLNHDLNCMTKFLEKSCVFQDLASGKTIGSAELCAGLYILKSVNYPRRQVCNAVGIPPQNSHLSQPIVKSMLNPLSSFWSNSQSNNDRAIMMWHYRLGHPNFVYLERIFPSLFSHKNSKILHCDICQFSKHTRSTYSPRSYKASKPFSKIHSDIWGPSRISNVSGAHWFLLFVDDHTRLSWVFLMKEKSETGQLFKTFHQMIKNQFNTNIQVLQTDNARDYFNSILGEYLQTHGIIHTSSCIDTPQQNGIAERKNRHLLEVARSLMFTSNVPKFFWGEAILTATYLINRMPSRTLNFKTPCESLLENFPTTHILHSIQNIRLYCFCSHT